MPISTSIKLSLACDKHLTSKVAICLIFVIDLYANRCSFKLLGDFTGALQRQYVCHWLLNDKDSDNATCIQFSGYSVVILVCSTKSSDITTQRLVIR